MSHAKLHSGGILVGIVFSCVMLGPASAQKPDGKGKPTKEEIALKAKGMRLDEGRAATVTKEGKKAKFIPAALEAKDENALASGTAVGQLNTDLSLASLPPGIYDVFVVKVDGKWKGFAAAENGTEVVEAAAAEVDHHAGGNGRPELKLGSLTITLDLFVVRISYTWN